MHAAIFWGFIVLFPTIVIAMIGAVDRESTLPWLGHQGWFALLVDVFATPVLAGRALARFTPQGRGPRLAAGRPPCPGPRESPRFHGCSPRRPLSWRVRDCGGRGR